MTQSISRSTHDTRATCSTRLCGRVYKPGRDRRHGCSHSLRRECAMPSHDLITMLDRSVAQPQAVVCPPHSNATRELRATWRPRARPHAPHEQRARTPRTLPLRGSAPSDEACDMLFRSARLPITLRRAIARPSAAQPVSSRQASRVTPHAPSMLPATSCAPCVLTRRVELYMCPLPFAVAQLRALRGPRAVGCAPRRPRRRPKADLAPRRADTWHGGLAVLPPLTRPAADAPPR